MSKEDILRTIRNLSYSQGFYGRLYDSIQRNPEILADLESQGFETELDLIEYLEC